MRTHETFAQWVSRVGNPMEDGWDVIYQFPMVHDGLRGIADFLVRVPEPVEGYATYEPYDAKLARLAAKPGHVLQLCFYADAIEALTGSAPHRDAPVARIGGDRVARGRAVRRLLETAPSPIGRGDGQPDD